MEIGMKQLAGTMLCVNLAVCSLNGASPPEIERLMKDEMVPETLWNLSFYLDALNRWGPAELDFSAEQSEAIALYQKWRESGQSADEDWNQRAGDLSHRIFQMLDESQEALFAQARKRDSDHLPYRCGLSLDRAPRGELRDFALFKFGVSRLGTQHHWSGKTDVSEQITFARDALDRYAEAGIKVVLQLTPDPGVASPVDLAYDQNLLPSFNRGFFPYNWNSRHRREFTNEQYQRFAWELGAHPALLEFKMGNEPFWSTRLNHITGFDQATVGCSRERWQDAILEKYGSFGEWTRHFEQVLKQRQYSAKPKEVIGWSKIEDVGFEPGDMRGLTFVEFLKDRYGSIEALNTAWFGDDQSRWYREWSSIFPPLPEEVAVGTKPTEWGDEWADLPIDFDRNKNMNSWRPDAKDIAAWMDWIAFLPYCINDALKDGRAAVKDVRPGLPVTSNTIGAHFLTDYLGLAPLGLRPWIMTDGLDSLAIDFYVIGYTQALMRSMTAIANGRPINIHEAGGTSGRGPRGLGVDPRNTTFMTLFSFAYGADSLLFWRDDHRMEPVLLHAVGRSLEALEDEELQNRSHPVTDAIALVYSGTSLRDFYAKWGHSYLYTSTVQAAVAAANKLQWQYGFYEEHDLEPGIPDDIRLLIVPGAAAISDTFLDSVHAFLERGGTLITTNDFGTTNQHGRPRDKQSLGRVLSHPNALVTSLADLKAWRGKVVVRNDDARFWSALGEPDWLKRWDDAAEKVAPRTVTCYNSDGKVAGDRIVAARRSSDSLYVFVDPWARDVSLHVRGSFAQARDSYSGSSFPVSHQNGVSIVSHVNGPAVIRFHVNQALPHGH